MKEPSFNQVGTNYRKWNMPDKEWLVDQYIIQGKIPRQIAEEVNTNVGTVHRWLDEYAIKVRCAGKVKLAKSIVIDGITMRPPASIKNGKITYWTEPDKVWLEYQYWTLEKSANDIGKEINCHPKTIRKWMGWLEIPLRTDEDRYRILGESMVGVNNPAYNGGTAKGTQKRECVRAGRPCVCTWCGKEGKLRPGAHESSTPTCSLDLHHKDHNEDNVSLDNLVYLCPKCHKLETALWHIRKFKKAKVTVANKIITIDFNI